MHIIHRHPNAKWAQYSSIFIELLRMQYITVLKENQIILHLGIFTYPNQNSVEVNWVEEKEIRIRGQHATEVIWQHWAKQQTLPF